MRLLIKGQNQTFGSIRAFSAKNQAPIVWFHAASLGEYEQAKPVIGAFRDAFPTWKIVLTFFSPSGYENIIKKSNEPLDLITYLPFDTPGKVNEFLKLVNPRLVFFVKYEVWPNYLEAIQKKQIPLYLFSASFRPDQVYFRMYGGFFRKALARFTHIFAQNPETVRLLESIGLTQVSLAGDTRYDRVHMTRLQPLHFPELLPFISGKKVMVLGSVWPEDMQVMLPYLNTSSTYQYIIAPHDINSSMLEEWKHEIALKSIKYSEWLINPDPEAKVLFVDNIGMLASLYQFAHLAYVGGAFGKGLHNILEPIAFGIPVIFGKLKKASKFPEAAISQKAGCGFSVGNAEAFERSMWELEDESNYRKACQAAEALVEANLGSASKIMDKVVQMEKEG